MAKKTTPTDEKLEKEMQDVQEAFIEFNENQLKDTVYAQVAVLNFDNKNVAKFAATCELAKAASDYYLDNFPKIGVPNELAFAGSVIYAKQLERFPDVVEAFTRSIAPIQELAKHLD